MAASHVETAGKPERTFTLPHQEQVEDFYESTHVQIAVAVIIGSNFLCNIIQKQIDPYGDQHEAVFDVFEYFFNVIFTIELGINLYGRWWKRFWKSLWNVFDVVVVTIGIITSSPLTLPSAFGLLRMMRAFRVFRLFNRVRSLNKIIVAIAHAVPGVRNTFIILAIIMSIYAILAVEFFQDVGQFCHDNAHPDRYFLTARGHCVGQEYFGSFSKSLYSFFQVLTGESWSEAVARPAIWYYKDDYIRFIGAIIFFVSFCLVSMIVLFNVVVAVLLDKMVDPAVDEVAEKVHPDGKAEEATAMEDSLIDSGELEAIDMQVKKLSDDSGKMRSGLDSARNEMATLREQIDLILRLVQDTMAGDKGDI